MLFPSFAIIFSEEKTGMKDVATIIIVTMALLFGVSPAQGQNTSDSSTVQKQSPATQRARVEFLAGTFATATNMPPPPSMSKGATGKGTSVISWTLDSMFLSIDEQSVNSLFGHYKGYGMLGFDAQTGQFVLSMFNNFGDHPIYHGNFIGDTLTLQTNVPAPKGTFDQKLLWYKDGDTVKMRVLNDFGKGYFPVLEQTATPVSQRTK
jgi:hypothetical protein